MNTAKQIRPLTDLLEMTQDLSLVPANRLGALLSASRHESGEDLQTIAKRSKAKFDLTALEQIERGKYPLSESQIRQLTKLYKIPSGKIIPERSHLIIDLNNQTLEAGAEQVTYQTDNVDEVLEKYLSLLYILRDTKPGSKLTLREPDLKMLEKALEIELKEVEQKLISLMSEPEVEKKVKKLLKKTVIPAAGLLVGLTAVGSLILVGSKSSQADVLVTPSTTAEIKNQLLNKSATTKNNITIENTSTTKSQTTQNLKVDPEPKKSPVKQSKPNSVQTNLNTGEQALQLLNFDVNNKLPGWKIEFKNSRPGFKGMTYVSDKKIEIYINSGESPRSVAEVLSHEIGHAIDVTYLSTSQRNEWLEMRKMPSVWWPGNGLTDFSVGAGDFAEAVSKVMTNSPSFSTHGEFSQEQLNYVRSLMP